MSKRAAKKTTKPAAIFTGPDGGVVFHVQFRFETDRARDSFTAKVRESYLDCIVETDGTTYYEGCEVCEIACNAAAECDFGNEIRTLRCDRR